MANPDSPGEYEPHFDEFDRSIRQGDVISFLSKPDLPPQHPRQWRAHLGVIVTADCDLAHHKHGGTLSYIPVVPTYIYSALIAFPRMADRIHKSAANKLKSILSPAQDWPTFDRITEILGQGKPTDSIARFLPDKPEARAAIQQIAILEAHEAWRHRYERGQTWSDILSAFEKLLASRALANGAKPKNIDQETLLRKEMGNFLRSSPPDDVMFLASPAHQFVNFMAYLRLIREIPLRGIALSAHQEFVEPNLIARRVGRLQPRYLHRLTQKMAAVFTDIGLPDEYDEIRELILEDFINNPLTTCKL